MKDIINIIKNNFDLMCDSHQQISKIVLRNETAIPKYTIQQLANESNVSIASVSKFCKYLELDGFDELRYLIKYNNTSAKSINNSVDLRENLFLTISSTHENIIDSVNNIVNLINKNSIYIFARSNSANIAYDFFYKLKKIKDDVYFERHPENIIKSMTEITEGIIILVSNSGSSTELYDLAKYIKKNSNLKIILITNTKSGKIAKYSDYIVEGVPLEIDSVMKQHLPFSSKYSLMYCLDMIFINYFNLDYLNNLNKIKSLQIIGR